jgi:predicted DNA-binding transcriptional regulator
MLTSLLIELIYAEHPQNTLGETGAPNAYFELGGKLFGEVANHIEHLATGMLGGNPYNPGKDIHDYLKELDPDKTKSTLVTLKRLYAKITEQVVMRPEIMDSFQELIDLRQKASLLYSSIVQSEKPGYLYSPTEAQRLTDKYAEVNAEIKKIENEIFGDPNTGSPAFTNSEPKLN